MAYPTIYWCPPTTVGCFPHGSAADEWVVDYRHGNSLVFYPIKMPGWGWVENYIADPIPTIDPFCPAPRPDAAHGVQSLPPACFGAAPMAQPAAGIPTAMPPCGLGGLPPTFNFICTVAAPQAVTTNPLTSAGICFPAAAPQAQASPDTILTLPPRCFGAATPGHVDAVNGVQTLPPACFGAPAPVAHNLPSLPQPICAASPASLSGCFPHTFFCHITLAHCPVTTITGGCPAPTSGGCPIPSQACGGFPVAGFMQTPSTFGVSDCGPTLGSPCHHPTQSGPACVLPAVNGVQTLPPACFGAPAPHAFDQQPSMPGVFGCPVIPSAAGGMCVFSVGCSGNQAMAAAPPMESIDCPTIFCVPPSMQCLPPTMTPECPLPTGACK